MTGNDGDAAGTAQVTAARPAHSGRLTLPEICNLAGDLLRPVLEKSTIVLSDDSEKRLLISLTKLYNDLDASKGYSSCDSISVAKICSPTDHTHNYVEEFFSLLVNCLSVSSQFVRHTSGKLFVALWNFIVENKSHWKRLVDTFYHTLDEAILRVHSSPSLLNLSVLTELFHIAQNVLKNLKLEEVHRDGDYLSILSERTLDVNWDLLHSIFTNEGKENKDLDEKNDLNINFLDLKAVLLGAILRLLCSFASDDWLKEPSGRLLDELPEFYGIIKLVPKLLCWCFCFDKKYYSVSIGVYVRHKVLFQVLMGRTSSYIAQEYYILVLWLQLLQKHFLDVLVLPLSQSKNHLDDSLEGSPFLPSVSHDAGAVSLHGWHIWRIVLFLLFKWSINLISSSSNSGVKCLCTTASPSSNCAQMNGKNCALGLSLLDDWVQRHFPHSQLSNYESYLMQCRDFTSSFLQMIMREDEVLFKMLLQLLDFSLLVDPVYNTQPGLLLQKTEVFRNLHLPCIFDPIQIFYLLVKELQFDHTIFLDYLISKDTGIECVHYLLRFLRLLRQQGKTFIRSSSANHDNKLFCKKRKLSSSTSTACLLEKKEAPPSFEGDRPLKLSVDEFERIKGFLFSLKTSIESLNNKSLFPYNPTAIIRSFMQFEEHCCDK